MADSTADSTAIIIIDATSWDYIATDNTGITNVEAAAANMLVNDFSDSSETMLTQANSIFEQLEGIKSLISGISPSDYTPDALLDTLTQQSLNAAFASSSWLTTKDGLADVQNIQNNCEVMKQVSKYVDTSSMIDSMKGGILGDAMNAISDVTSKFKIDFPSLSLPEFEIGKQLSDLINTGRSVYDSIKTSAESAVSDVIAHGKGGLAKAQSAINKAGAAVDGAIEVVESGISSLGPGLKILDGLINCTDSIGGAAYAGKADQMIDRANDIFDKAGVESDPASPNFGEFDENSFFDSIGGLTPSQKSKILKGANTYMQASNNALLVADKAQKSAETAQEWEKSTSSLSGGGNKESSAQKSNYVSDNVKVEVEIPAVPGGAKASTQTATTQPEPPANTTAPTQEAPRIIPFINLVKEIEVKVNDTSYNDYDPDGLEFPDYKSMCMNLLPPGGVEEQYAQGKELVGSFAIGKCTAEIGVSNIESKAICAFAWSINEKTNRGVSGINIGKYYFGPFSGGVSDNVVNMTVTSAVKEAIRHMVLPGDTTDKGASYFLELLFKNT